MPILFAYLVKVSVSLGLVYLFYRAVLQNLTFFSWNRWYLLGFSVLSFFLPFINIAALLEPTQSTPARLITYVPALESYTTQPFSGSPVLPTTTASATPDPWQVLLIIFLTGIFILLIKMGMQLWSYLKFKETAQLVSNGSIKVYQVNQPISPFSFGHAVYLNKNLHTKAEFAEIIRHEFVHVKQGHTLDIIWSEIMCMLNWYNPFAWLLRHSIRQNLEFIADNQVVLSGINKKQYQYLLLKVTGAPEFSLTNQFSFLALKKRIVMMNKMPSTRTHLVKFLLVLPLLTVSLIAFRSVKENNAAMLPEAKFIQVYGMVVNAQTLEPLSQAQLIDEYSKTKSLTDDRGYYTLKIPVSAYPVKTRIQVKKPGFATFQSTSEYSAPPKKEAGRIEFIGLADTKKNGRLNSAFVAAFSAPVNVNANPNSPSYEAVLISFKELKEDKQNETDLKALVKDSEKPYWVVNGNSYIVSADGGYASTDEVTDIVFVDGKKMTGEEVNRTLKRSTLSTLGALEKEEAFKKYGINKPLLLIYLHTNPEDNKILQPRSGSVEILYNSNKNLTKGNRQQNPTSSDYKIISSYKLVEKQILNVVFKDGTQEKYDLSTEAGQKAFTDAQRFDITSYTNKQPDSYKAFLKRNPQVKKVNWLYDHAEAGNPEKIFIYLQSGKEEVYNLKSKSDINELENKYGKLPPPRYARPTYDAEKYAQYLKEKSAVKKFEPPTITPDHLPADHRDFLNRNPQVKTVGWQGNEQMVLFLKSGKQEKYNLNKDESKAQAVKKYGNLPKAPFPPPPAKNKVSLLTRAYNDTSTIKSLRFIGTETAVFELNTGGEEKYNLKTRYGLQRFSNRYHNMPKPRPLLPENLVMLHSNGIGTWNFENSKPEVDHYITLGEKLIVSLKSGEQEIYYNNQQSRPIAEKKYGKLPFFSISNEEIHVPVTLPENKLSADYKSFLMRNPNIKSVGRRPDGVLVVLYKSGYLSELNLEAKDVKKLLEKETGKLPNNLLPTTIY